MAHRDTAPAHRKGGAIEALDAEQIERHAKARDVEDRIDLTDFVKVDRVDRAAVHQRFGFPEPPVDRRRASLLPFAQAAAGDDLQHVGQMALAGRVAVRGMARLVTMRRVILARQLRSRNRSAAIPRLIVRSRDAVQT